MRSAPTLRPGLSDRHDPVWRAWAALAAVLLVSAPALLIDLGRRDSTHTMENVALVTSMETWFRVHAGEPRAWLMTSNDGAPRIEKPPMLAWLNLLAWSDQNPADASPAALLLRARLVTAALGLLLVASIFWTGHVLGGLRVALLAALVAGSTWFVQRQARTASYDMHFVSWTALAAASALWAMVPVPGPVSVGRRLAGWCLCAAALVAAVFSKNPLPMALAAVPILGAIRLAPRHRRGGHLAWFIAVFMVVGAIFGSWYLYAVRHVTDPLARLGTEFTQPRSGDAQPFWYYLGLLGLMLPWSIWLVGGLVLPFDRSVRPMRLQVLLPWLWFIIIFIGFSIPPAKQQRYILAIVPAAALLVSMMLVSEQQRCDEGARPHPLLLWAHWLALLIVSPLLGPFLAAQDWLVETGWLSEPLTASVSWWLALGGGAAMTALAIGGLTAHRRCGVLAAGACTALWAMIATTLFWHAYSRAPSAEHPLRAPTEALSARIGAAPLASLRLPQDRGRVKLNEEFRFYLGRPIRRIGPDELEAFAASATGGPVYVLSRTNREQANIMRGAGFTAAQRVVEDDGRELQLWVRGGTPGDGFR
jgi:4-amino-4-deoxy-L-arabinose transferase-like glycosyltransferase